MTSFVEFVSYEDDLFESFIFVGSQVQVLSESGSVEDRPEARSAVNFISDVVRDIKNAMGSVVAFLKKLASMSLDDAVMYCREGLSKVESEFGRVYQSLRGRLTEGVVSGSLHLLKRGFQYLVNKLMMPVLRWMWESVLATARHLFSTTREAGRSAGFSAYLVMFVAAALTVGLWPVFSLLSLGGAIGSSGLWIWLIFMLMTWFKVNVIGRAFSLATNSPS